MTRFLLALRCFFAVLLGSRLPPQAAALLLPANRNLGPGEPAAVALTPSGKAPPPTDKDPAGVGEPAAADPGDRAAAPAAVSAPAAVATAGSRPAPVASAPVAVFTPEEPARAALPLDAAAQADQRRRGAVQVLAVLQREGRLLDFLSENIDTYTDGQIGAAVRDIHRGCRKALAEHVKVSPIRPEPSSCVSNWLRR